MLQNTEPLEYFRSDTAVLVNTHQTGLLEEQNTGNEQKNHKKHFMSEMLSLCLHTKSFKVEEDAKK